MSKNEDIEDQKKPTSEFSALSEEEETFKGVIRWHVSKSEIEKYLESVGKCIKSDTFSIGSPSYCSFHFLLYPSGRNESFDRFVSTSVIFNRNLPKGAWIKGVIYIDEFVGMKTFSVCGKDINKRIDFDNMISPSYAGDMFQMNDGCIFHSSIKITVKRVNCKFDKKSVQYVQSRNYDLHRESFKRELFTDVTVIVEDHEIKTHKVVLAQVPYFQELFDENKSKQHFELSNIRHTTFAHLLDFLYTRNIPRLNFNLACELFIVASDLKIFDLKNMCTAYLGANLTETNVFIVLKLAHEYHEASLKIDCIKFIRNSNVELLAEKSVVL